MKFFIDKQGRYYPVSEIARISKYSGKRDPLAYYYGDVEMKDGRTTLVSEYNIDEIVEDTGSLLSAQPGFSLLKFWYDPGEDDETIYVSDDPVLGWKISDADGLQPITIDNEEYDHRCGILCPDGKVRNYDTVWDDRAAWEASMKHDAEQQAEAKRVAKAKKAELDAGKGEGAL